MVVVLVIVIAWAVVLGPGIIRRYLKGGIGSIHHFHHQLEILEQNAVTPPMSAPAFRLHVVDGTGAITDGDSPVEPTVPVLTVVRPKETLRPALAFLGQDPVPAVDESDVHGTAGLPTAERLSSGWDRTGLLGPDGYERTYDPGAYARSVGHPAGEGLAGRTPDLRPRRDRTELFDVSARLQHRSVELHHRQLLRQRRRDTLVVLVAVFALTAIVGFVPGASVAWLVTLVSGVSLAGYVFMLVHLRRRAEEHERKLHYLDGGARRAPGFVDDERRQPGRSDHPSVQTAATR